MSDYESWEDEQERLRAAEAVNRAHGQGNAYVPSQSDLRAWAAQDSPEGIPQGSGVTVGARPSDRLSECTEPARRRATAPDDRPDPVLAPPEPRRRTYRLTRFTTANAREMGRRGGRIGG